MLDHMDSQVGAGTEIVRNADDGYFVDQRMKGEGAALLSVDQEGHKILLAGNMEWIGPLVLGMHNVLRRECGVYRGCILPISCKDSETRMLPLQLDDIRRHSTQKNGLFDSPRLQPFQVSYSLDQCFHWQTFLQKAFLHSPWVFEACQLGRRWEGTRIRVPHFRFCEMLG